MTLPSLRELHSEILEERNAAKKSTLFDKIAHRPASAQQTPTAHTSGFAAAAVAGAAEPGHEGATQAGAEAYAGNTAGNGGRQVAEFHERRFLKLPEPHEIGSEDKQLAMAAAETQATVSYNPQTGGYDEPQRERAAGTGGGERAEAQKGAAPKKKYGASNFAADALFYIAIAVIMVSVMTSGGSAGSPKTVFGYSYFTVLTSSMQNEIPKNSFILVKKVDPKDLKVGDNITYMRDYTTSVTHKIIEVIENYDGSRKRGFRTQGTNNANPDKDIVPAANVVGKVVYSVPTVGALILYLESNLHLVYIIFGLCMLFSFSIRGLLAKPNKDKK